MSSTIDNLSGREFEDLVESLLQRMGFTTEGRKPSADGGVDIVARNPQPIVGGKYIVQCKRYRDPVPVAVVRDLFGVVTHERASKGILITTSRFTRDAEEFAAGKPLELIDRKKLVALLQGHEVPTPVAIPGNIQVFADALRPGIKKVFERFQDVDRRAVVIQPKVRVGRNYARWFAQLRKKYDVVMLALGQIISASLPGYLTRSEPDPERARRDAKKIVEALEELQKGWEACLATDAPWLVRNRQHHLMDNYRAYVIFGLQFGWLIDEVAKGKRSLPPNSFRWPPDRPT